MDFEAARPRIAFLTALKRASEGFLPAVNQLMRGQVPFRYEALSTALIGA